jgi:hypothetical protein
VYDGDGSVFGPERAIRFFPSAQYDDDVVERSINEVYEFLCRETTSGFMLGLRKKLNDGLFA